MAAPAPLFKEAFSTVGRNTARELARLKVKAGLEPAPQTNPHKASTESRGNKPAPEIGEGEDEPEQPVIEKETIAFTSKGQDYKAFDDYPGHTNTHRRWVRPTGEDKPPVGRYRPNTDFVNQRNPNWDFVKNQGRKPILKKVEYFGPDFERSNTWGFGTMSLSPTDSMMASTQSGLSSPASPSTLSLISRATTDTRSPWSPSPWASSPKHRDLVGKGALQPGRTWTSSEQIIEWKSTAPEDLEEQDRRTTKVPRPPRWDISEQFQLGRSDKTTRNYFEPGKYKIKWDYVDRDPDRAMHHGKQLGFDSLQRTRSAPAGINDASIGIVPDRSFHRNAVAPRCTDVLYMEKVLDRPPLMTSPAGYHDESDPDIDAKVMEWQMTVDKSTVDKAVVPRKDLGMTMKQSSTRRVAKQALRFVACKERIKDYPEAAGSESASVEALKERPSRLRADIGLSFHQYSGRQRNSYTNLSSLRKPRSMAFDDFERQPALRGFEPRVTAEIPDVLRLSRSFEPMPGFDASAIEAL